MNAKRLSALFAALLMVLSMQGCGKPAGTWDAAAALAIFDETQTTEPGRRIVAAGETAPEETEAYGETDETEEGYEADEAYGDLYSDVYGDAYGDEQEPEEEYLEESEDYVCYISISCGTILDNYDSCDPDKWEIVPADGVILRETAVEFTPGESVFDVLQRVCRNNGIHMESEWTPLYNSAYIEGIYNLYEFDVGAESGWMYCVNGWFPNYGCSRYEVESGDNIQWLYTCSLGDDIGGGNALG